MEFAIDNIDNTIPGSDLSSFHGLGLGLVYFVCFYLTSSLALIFVMTLRNCYQFITVITNTVVK